MAKFKDYTALCHIAKLSGGPKPLVLIIAIAGMAVTYAVKGIASLTKRKMNQKNEAPSLRYARG